MVPPPQVQCSTGPLWAVGLEDAFDAIAEAGFEGVELMVTRDPRTQEPGLPGRLAEERGLRIAAVHAPFLLVTRSVWGLSPIEKIQRGTAMCAALGAGVLVVHPPLLWERRYASWLKDEVEELSLSGGVTVAVETMYPAKIRGRSIRGYRWLDPPALERAAPHVVLDTSHVAMCEVDLLDAYAVLRDKLVHIHLSDNAEDGRDGHLEPGAGTLAIPELMAALLRDGYRGGVCLELALQAPGAQLDNAVSVLSRSREKVEAIMGAPRGS